MTDPTPTPSGPQAAARDVIAKAICRAWAVWEENTNPDDHAEQFWEHYEDDADAILAALESAGLVITAPDAPHYHNFTETETDRWECACGVVVHRGNTITAPDAPGSASGEVVISTGLAWQIVMSCSMVGGDYARAGRSSVIFDEIVERTMDAMRDSGIDVDRAAAGDAP